MVRAEVLRALFHHTQREMYVREIARWSELALRTGAAGAVNLDQDRFGDEPN